MPIVRIESVYIENTEKTEDKLLFDAFLQSDGHIKPMEIFGYAMENGDKWPITITLRKQSNVGVLDWGAGDGETKSTINIFEKKVAVGEYFTRTDKVGNDKDEYTYRITRIFNWDEIS